MLFLRMARCHPHGTRARVFAPGIAYDQFDLALVDTVQKYPELTITPSACLPTAMRPGTSLPSPGWLP